MPTSCHRSQGPARQCQQPQAALILHCSKQHVIGRVHSRGQQLQSCCPNWLRDTAACTSTSNRRPHVHCLATNDRQEPIQGYTPANYISYTEGEQHRCHHMAAVEVQAPPSVCYSIWNDWTRLVDFLDLVSQIGLDPAEPHLGLFQCFYRWGRMPVMEIVFLARKTHMVENTSIAFDTIWGLPAKGDVQFVASEDGSSTTVIFRLEHQLPWLLVDLKVGVFGVEQQLRQIFSENLEEFRKVAEAQAQQGGARTQSAQQAATQAGQQPQPQQQRQQSQSQSRQATAPVQPTAAQYNGNAREGQVSSGSTTSGGKRGRAGSVRPSTSAPIPSRGASTVSDTSRGGSPGGAGVRGRGRSRAPTATP